VLAADDLAEGRRGLGDRSFIVPTIVTTASLHTARYDPRDVSLETGEFPSPESLECERVDWIRFQKTFTAGRGNTPRTVMVVNAAALPRFLDEISRGQGLLPAGV
jgi:hypothetical protein